MTGSADEADYQAKLADYYRWYAAETFEGYEPHYDRVCRAIADTPAVIELISKHPEDAHQPNVILAAARYLLADDPDHPLARVYAAQSNADPGPLFCDLVLSRSDEINTLMATRRTQTNEVGRAAALALGLGEIYRRGSAPLAWIDLGCSAGLNLQLDQLLINYRFADRVESTGNTDSPLSIECEVVGGSPRIPAFAPPIDWRLGIDRAPIHPSDSLDARWLRSCVFPSRAERSARLDAALAIAQANPFELRAADAVAGMRTAIAEVPTNLTLAVTTSWVWYYLPLDTRAGVLEVMRSAGRPVHWFSLEAEGVVEGVDVGPAAPTDRAYDASAMVLSTHDGRGNDTNEFVGWTHHHGLWVDWRLS